MTRSVVGERFRMVECEVIEAARRCGRQPGDIRLVAVSKTVDPRRLQEALREGVATYGENYVQEASSKWPDLRAHHPTAELHLVGPLQTKKVAEAVRLFDVVHSLDRAKLASAFARSRDRGSSIPRLLVQVNIGAEPQKAGVSTADLTDFVDTCKRTYGLDIEGLMCIPPAGRDPDPYFAELDRIRTDLGLRECSMGMSSDFVRAIEHGATIVRVGSRIFGDRVHR